MKSQRLSAVRRAREQRLLDFRGSPGTGLSLAMEPLIEKIRRGDCVIIVDPGEEWLNRESRETGFAINLPAETGPVIDGVAHSG